MLIVSEEAKADRAIVECACVGFQKCDEQDDLHGSSQGRGGARCTVLFVGVLYHCVEHLQVECPAGSEYTLQLGPEQDGITL